MKKFFAFAAMFAAVAMVSCGGQQKAAEEAVTEEAQACCTECVEAAAEECCGECTEECTEECEGECEKECCGEYAEATEAPAEVVAE